MLIVDSVEGEAVFVRVFGEIHFESEWPECILLLSDCDRVGVFDRHYIPLVAHQLLLVEWSLADDDLYFGLLVLHLEFKYDGFTIIKICSCAVVAKNENPSSRANPAQQPTSRSEIPSFRPGRSPSPSPETSHSSRSPDYCNSLTTNWPTSRTTAS